MDDNGTNPVKFLGKYERSRYTKRPVSHALMLSPNETKLLSQGYLMPIALED